MIDGEIRRREKDTLPNLVGNIFGGTRWVMNLIPKTAIIAQAMDFGTFDDHRCFGANGW